jgi:two-component system cell cycle response regulator
VLKQLQADALLAEIPVVFLTARTTTEDVVEGLRLGAHDYLCKPFEPAELLARVSAAIRVKTLQDELRQRNSELATMSNTDALTSLPNRRYLQNHLISACSTAARENSGVAVLMIDADHFKKVNDTLGHDVGDIVLRDIADRLVAACGASGIAGRWGGEEFIVIATSDLVAGVALAERIRVDIAREPVQVGDGRVIDVTVSIGVAAGELDPEELLRAADGALYRAKANGRDQVVS